MPQGPGSTGKARAAILRWRSERSGVSGPMGLAGLARHAAVLSRSISDLAEAGLAERGAAVSCAKGCGACCRQVVPLGMADACALADTLEGLEWDRRAEADEAFDRAAESLRAAGMEEASLPGNADRYFALGIPCPFLRDEACGVHAERPLVCRDHLVTSPKEFCSDFPSPFAAVVAMPFYMGDVMLEVTGDLLGTKSVLPLVRLREWMASDPETRAMRWDATALFDRLAAACLARLG